MIYEALSVARGAERLIGTAWRHQGRSRRSGVDCVGIAVLAHAFAGAVVLDSPDYPASGSAEELIEQLQRNMQRLPEWAEAGPGCVGRVKFGKGGQPRHLFIVGSSGKIVHAVKGRGVVPAGASRWIKRAVDFWIHPNFLPEGAAWQS